MRPAEAFCRSKIILFLWSEMKNIAQFCFYVRWLVIIWVYNPNGIIVENNVTLDFVVNKPAEEPRHCNSLLLFLSVPLIEIEKKVAAPDWMCFLCSYFDPAIVNTEFFLLPKHSKEFRFEHFIVYKIIFFEKTSIQLWNRYSQSSSYEHFVFWDLAQIITK